MKLRRTLNCLYAVSGILFLALGAQAQTQEREYGPPRSETIQGDVPAAPLSAGELDNLLAFTRIYTLARWFHPSDEALATDWDQFAIEAIPPVIEAQSQEDLIEVLELQFAPIVAGFAVSQESPPESSITTTGARWQWVHQGYEGALPTGYSQRREMISGQSVKPPHVERLSNGLWLTMPLSAPVEESSQTNGVKSRGLRHKPQGWIAAGFDRTTRLAGTVIAWGIIDQFYPYWDVVDVDWDQTLADTLQNAATAPDDRAYRDVLDAMMIAMQDGHAGSVYDQRHSGRAPIRLRLVENQLIISAIAADSELELGAIVETIDGRPAGDELTRRMKVGFAGSLHFRRFWTVTELPFGEKGTEMVLGVLNADGRRQNVALERLDRSEIQLQGKDRPDSITEIEEGILYVDLTRIDNDLFNESFARMAAARAIVFDVRGRPKVRSGFLANLSDSRTVSAKFLMPTFIQPDQEGVTFQDFSWQIEPAAPRFPSNLVFLTDARAISYPESLLGLIKGNKLAPIVGNPTAGANGNITAIDLPGGYRLFFTGLKVINQDGSIHHNIGVLPDVWVEPTIAGVRSGLDEVLDAGVSLVRGRMSEN